MSARLSYSDLVASLSHALDLTEGQPAGHAVRTCLIGMEIARALELPHGLQSDLYYALLLKDAGCSANAAPVARAFGSHDHRVKRAMKTTDWSRYIPAARYALKHAAVKGTTWERIRHMVGLARGGDAMAREFTRIRCSRGAEIALELGFSRTTSEAIRHLDEHWDGRGHPEGISGTAIPLLARIACLAQTVDVFLEEGGPAAVTTMVKDRRGRWFDPQMADVVLGWRGRDDWWRTVHGAVAPEALRGVEPDDRIRLLTAGEVDRVAEAFAEVIDAKSPFTYRHSRRVAQVARIMGRRRGLAPDEVQRLYRAGLLHDIGKLGVSNLILDKPGNLDSEEWALMRDHPRHSLEILQHVPAFADVAYRAAYHHERLDGSGYPWGLDGDRLDEAARALAVADVFEALTAARPYRDGIPVAQVLDMMRVDAGDKLDPDMVDTLLECVDGEGEVAERHVLAESA